MARPDPASLEISASTETTDFKWEQQGVRRPKENAGELLGGTQQTFSSKQRPQHFHRCNYLALDILQKNFS